MEFFLVFIIIYKESITTQNCQVGFRGTGLVPFDPQIIFSKFDVKLQTPTPFKTSIANINPWIFQIFCNLIETFSQIIFIRNRITHHQKNLLTPFFETIITLTKNIERIAHKMTLLSVKVHTFRAANKALSKRYRTKKARIRQGGVLIVENRQDIIAQKDVDEQVRRDICAAKGSRKEGQSSGRHCGICGKAGHNARTCQGAVDIISLSDSE